MPPKYFQPKGNNKEKLENNPMKNPHRITKTFHEQEKDDKLYEYWWNYWDSYYDYSNYSESVLEVSLLENTLMEPNMILKEQQLDKLPLKLTPNIPQISKNNARKLGAGNPLKHSCEDSRLQKVSQPLSFPYSCIGIVTFIHKQISYFSTGTIVGDNLVLTAASSCFSINRNDEHLYIAFTPSFEANKGRIFKAKNIYIPAQFKDISNPDRLLYNFCLIQLITDISLAKYFGCLPIKLQNESGEITPNYYQSTLCGFVMGQSGFPEMRKTKVNVTDNFDVIRYQFIVSSQEGLGGSPIISEELQIIGLHNYTSQSTQVSSYGLASISWLLCDFIKEIPKKKLKIYESDISKFEFKDTEDIGKLYLAENNSQNWPDATKKLEQICSSSKDWHSLNTLYIQGIIDPQCCRLLSKGNFNRLLKLKLNRNCVGDEGCLWLSEANWNLIELHLAENQIKNEGIDWLISAEWKNLREFNFAGNNLEGEYQRWIPKSEWPRLTQLSLSISEHCDLEESGWTHIRMLYIHGGNCVVQRWDKWLLKKDWKNLIAINFEESNIGNKGCKWIHQAHLNLRQLCLGSNSISDDGVKWLVKSNWKDITSLRLNKNNLTNQSCRHLSIANWPNLSNLWIYQNRMRRLGLKYLMKASFKKELNFYFTRMHQDRRNYAYHFPF